MTRTDLTRWNRTGLSKFDYVDGNAPVFLEHLRAAMIAKFTRGLPHSDEGRDPNYWFDLMRDAQHLAPAAGRFDGKLDWDALADGLAPLNPDQPETKAARNARLVANYNATSEDYSAEMMRASARAAHVMAGYINAYMNEGYLATATQWSSLARLGAMVNYAPAPAASASTTVALSLKAESGTVTLPRGLATSAPSPNGGSPVIFETLTEITCHPALNEARQRRWNVNRSEITLNALNDWQLAGQKAPAPGTPVVIAPGKFREPSAKAALVSRAHASRDGEAARIALQDRPSGKWRKGYTEMWYDPEGAARGLRVEHVDMTIVTVDKTAGLALDSLVEFQNGRYGVHQAVVSFIGDDRIGLTGTSSDLGEISAIRPMVPFSVSNGYFDTSTATPRAYFNQGGEPKTVVRKSTAITDHTQVTTGRLKNSDGSLGAYRYASSGAIWGGIPDSGGPWIDVKGPSHPPKITEALHDPGTIVPFKGKPPKSLKEGDYYLARGSDDTLTALRVRGFRTDDGTYHIAFNKAPSDAFEKTMFFGPMRSVIRPQDHDKSVASVVDADGTVTLAGLPDDAKALLQVGKKVIIEDKRETGFGSILATVQKICDESGNGQNEVESDQVKIVLTSVEFDLTAFIAGWTVFRFNALSIGHGETKPGKTLGSGNGETLRQTLPLEVKGISFVSDAKAATGVRPDIDVAVDGTIWSYSDLTDPEAEGSDSYAIRTRDDDTLDIVFRRRLPTGRNNIRVSRHRVGSGRNGNGIGPQALTKPKSKHKHVASIFQPFTTAGGADRESTDSIRENAGAAIAANDRAVSLADFTRLTRRHASIWDARAVEDIHPGRSLEVAITVVPVDGVTLDPTQSEGLQSYITERALPGTVARIHHFQPVSVKITASVRADFAMITEDDVIGAATFAIAEAFSLQNRSLGQPLFVAELLAELERLNGVVTATASMSLGPSVISRPGLTFSSASGVIRAIHPLESETAFIQSPTDISISVESAND